MSFVLSYWRCVKPWGRHIVRYYGALLCVCPLYRCSERLLWLLQGHDIVGEQVHAEAEQVGTNFAEIVLQLVVSAVVLLRKMIEAILECKMTSQCSHLDWPHKQYTLMMLFTASADQLVRSIWYVGSWCCT